jgi:hypothetical protein
MQAAGDMTAASKTSHKSYRVSLSLQFIDDALESRSDVRGYAGGRTRFCPHYSGSVMRPEVGYPAVMPVTSMMRVPNIMPNMMNAVVSLNVMRAMLVMPVSRLG